MNRTGRLPRTHIPNTIHHVMIRGNNRQNIFFNQDCFQFFLKIIEESAKKFDHKILGFCLMTNHAHLIIHIHNEPLSNVMKNINYRYARWINKHYRRIGHLFQGRYRSIAVNDEEYLINLCRYVHFNPVEAKMVYHPDHYYWSSHHYFISENPPEWMEINLILSAIKNKTGCSYLEFISKLFEREEWKPGLFLSENGEIVIDVDVVRDLHPVLNINENEYTQNKKLLSPTIVSEIVCKNLNINQERLLNSSRARKNSRNRILLAHCWSNYTTLTLTEIAKRLGRTHGTLQRQLDQLEKQRNNYFSPELLAAIQSELELSQQSDC